MFRLLWAFDALVTLVVVGFFLWGLADGSVSSFNMGLWLGTLAVVAAVMLGSLGLRAAGWGRVAAALLLVLAVPGALYAFFVVLVVVAQPRWN